jgi:predicted enzyme related to lactoylglutathione lyase
VLLGLNGLRVSEACETNVEDLGLERGHRTPKIMGKGHKPATIPLVPRTARTTDLAVGERAKAQFECPDGGSTFSIHLAEELAPNKGVVIYFECENLDAKVSELKSRGYSFAQDPRDEQWLWREARLRDPANNEICLYWAGQNRRYPPWRVQS